MAWQVFISYAREDGPSLAHPLADALHRAGVEVWLDEQQIEPGQELTTQIIGALRDTRFGVPVLSRSYLRKEWTRRELATLIETHRSRIIPVLAPDLSMDEVKAFSPTLAEIVLLTFGSSPSGIRTLEETAEHIARVVRRGRTDRPRPVDGSDRLLQIRARHWIRPDRTVAAEVANVFVEIRSLKMVIEEAADLLVEICPDAPRLSAAHVPLEGGARYAWETALDEAAKRDPRTLAALLLVVRARAGIPMPETEACLATIEHEEPVT